MSNGLEQYTIETLFALKRDYERARKQGGLDEWATLRLIAIKDEIEKRLEKETKQHD